MAKSKNIGKLYVTLGADTRQFRSKMGGVRKETKKTGASFTAFKATVIGAFAALGVGAAVRGIRSFTGDVKRLAEYGAQLDRRARHIGVSTRELQIYQRALDALGGSEEVFAKAIDKTVQNFYDAGQGLKTYKDLLDDLKVSEQEIAGVRGDAVKQFELILQKYSELEKIDKAKALGIGVKFFGARIAREVLPFAATFQSEKQRAAEQGGFLADGTVKDLDKLNHELDVFNQKLTNMKAEFVAINGEQILELQAQWHSALEKLYPILKDVAAATAEWAESFGETYAEVSRRERRVDTIRGAGGNLPVGISGLENWLPGWSRYIDSRIEKQIGPALSIMNQREFYQMATQFGLDRGLINQPQPRPRREYDWQMGEGFTLTPETQQAIKDWEQSIEEFTNTMPGLVDTFRRVDRLARFDVFKPTTPRGEALPPTLPTETEGTTFNRAQILADDRAAFYNALLQQRAGGISDSRRLSLTGASVGEVAGAAMRESLDDAIRAQLRPLKAQQRTLSERQSGLLAVGDETGAAKAAMDLKLVETRIGEIETRWKTAIETIYPGLIDGARKVAVEEQALLEQWEAKQEALATRTAIIGEVSQTLAGGLTDVFATLGSRIEDTEEKVKQLGRTLIEVLTQRLITDQLAQGLSSLITAGVNGWLAPGPTRPGANYQGVFASAAGGNSYNIQFNGVSGPGVRQAINAEVPGIVDLATANVQSLAQNPSTALGRTGHRRAV